MEDGRWKQEPWNLWPSKRGKREAISWTWVRWKMEEGRWKRKIEKIFHRSGAESAENIFFYCREIPALENQLGLRRWVLGGD